MEEALPCSAASPQQSPVLHWLRFPLTFFQHGKNSSPSFGIASYIAFFWASRSFLSCSLYFSRAYQPSFSFLCLSRISRLLLYFLYLHCSCASSTASSSSFDLLFTRSSSDIFCSYAYNRFLMVSVPFSTVEISSLARLSFSFRVTWSRWSFFSASERASAAAEARLVFYSFVASSQPSHLSASNALSLKSVVLSSTTYADAFLAAQASSNSYDATLLSLIAYS